AVDPKVELTDKGRLDRPVGDGGEGGLDKGGFAGGHAGRQDSRRIHPTGSSTRTDPVNSSAVNGRSAGSRAYAAGLSQQSRMICRGFGVAYPPSPATRAP